MGDNPPSFWRGNNRSLWLKNASVEKSERKKPREGKGGKNPGRSNLLFFPPLLLSMIKLVHLLRRTDLNLLLCNNHKGLIYLRVYKRWIAFRPNQCGFFGTFSAKDRICCSVFVARVLRKTRTQLVSNTLHHVVFSFVLLSVAHRRQICSPIEGKLGEMELGQCRLACVVPLYGNKQGSGWTRLDRSVWTVLKPEIEKFRSLEDEIVACC